MVKRNKLTKNESLLAFEKVKSIPVRLVAIEYMCAIGKHRQVHFLWRPTLKDPSDDFILELAVESECNYIVTHNLRDFKGTEKFKVKAISPQELLQIIGDIS